VAATITRRMPPARGDKPYTVYRGGRVKGKVPTLPRPERKKAETDGQGRVRYTGPGPKPTRQGWSWRRRIALGLLILFLFVFVWLLAAYLSFRSGVAKANDRLPDAARRALTKQDGLLLNHSTDILLLGTDHSAAASRAGDRHSDSIMLVRTDPDHHRLAYLSIPRDLRVNIPDHGFDKINYAFQSGGPRLAAATVHAATGLPVNHLITVEFASFKELIDELGGIDIYVPYPIRSKFDCPYGTKERCDRWPGWRFAKGKQHLDGRRALMYTRVRHNELNPGDNDVTRAARQQAVVEAIIGKLTSVSTFFKLPFVGGDLMKPLATDLSANQLLQIGWLKMRASKVLHCRLGGDWDGQYIQPSEENRNVILMVTGKSAPQPPAPSNEEFPPGCFVGKQLPGAR
jgi:polyisoprenyl-teichoic acid--peptidoglycan teichoic acid transferase